MVPELPVPIGGTQNVALLEFHVRVVALPEFTEVGLAVMLQEITGYATGTGGHPEADGFAMQLTGTTVTVAVLTGLVPAGPVHTILYV